MTEKDFKQIFPLGEKNDAYAQYFVGQSYLSMLTTERVGIANVTMIFSIISASSISLGRMTIPAIISARH